MGKPYFTEMGKLAETFSWALNYDITRLRKTVQGASSCPLLAIGSGGSLTAAHALTTLHRTFTGRIATVATPLEAITEPLESQFSAWLLSASGRNVDILAAFRALVDREPKQLSIICGKNGSPLGKLSQSYGYTDLIEFESPAGKDGFLATNSLLAFVTLLTRAYMAEFGEGEEGAKNFAKSIKKILSEDNSLKIWQQATTPLWERETTLVLHGISTRIGAIDLESKFTEAAIGNLQIADYRNFAHGRHHWLAKHGNKSAVLAFTAPEDRVLADRTLALIPSDIPLAKIEIHGNNETSVVTSLIAALQISGWAAKARGIDPGRPGVPDFGRKLYHLPLPKKRIASERSQLPDETIIAIERKSGLSFNKPIPNRELKLWHDELIKFVDNIQQVKFKGIIFDYDGTLVDTRERFSPLRPVVATKLKNLIKAGIRIAIATGRGVSIRRDLQNSLPKSMWSSVIVGYYNGAEIGLLSDDTIPNGKEEVCSKLRNLAKILKAQPELAEIAKQTNRHFQITLEPKKAVPENRLWDIAHQVILSNNVSGINITRSSHSVDIIAPDVSKLNVLKKLEESVGKANMILKIGDRGRWPGNDFSLLREPYSLSVDELSVDPNTCWNLAPRGRRGLDATLFYLDSMVTQKNSLMLKFKKS